jgi:hypothetical protein
MAVVLQANVLARGGLATATQQQFLL